MAKRRKRKKNIPPGMKECQLCKSIKALTEFHPERQGAKNRFCAMCATANMRRYWRSRQVGRMPEEISEIE